MNTLQSPTTKKPLGKRLVLGFAGALSAAVIGSAGLAAASPSHHPSPQPGNGYGGSNNTVNTEIDLEVNGNNNVINIVINYMFGH